MTPARLLPDPVIDEEVLRKEFLFIVGSPRSGTTWLQLMLGSHPSVCATAELTLYDKYLAPWLDAWWQGRDTTLPSEAAVTAEAEGLDYPVLLCGHTHTARVVRLRDGRLIVNPGSVGLQMVHGSPDARYAILDRRNGEWSVMLCAIPYDHQGAAEQARRHGFTRWIEALNTGWAGPEGLF